MHAGNWYAFPDIFELVDRLPDGESLYRCPASLAATFEDGNLTLSRFGDTLQMRLTGVADASVDGVPGLAELAPRLLREHLLPLRESSFPWRCLVKTEDNRFVSNGLVCAELLLRSFDHGSFDHRKPAPHDRLREIEDAFSRGLLDDALHRRADFRLRIRPAIDEFNALRDSGFVPAYRINVLFSTWRDSVTDDWEVTPLAGCDNFQFSFEPQPRRRGFRMTDLFDSSR